MKTLNITQNSPAWHAARAQHFCASEAPAMAGVSKYAGRTDLLKQKATGISAEADPAKQRLFDAGHQAEAAARVLAEGIIGQDLFPVVGVREIDGLKLLASFDGISMDEAVIWEHKLWSHSLAKMIDEVNEAQHAGDKGATHYLDPHYCAQLDHQLWVSGAEKCLFMCSDGTEANMAWCWYESVQEKFDALLSGWAQFHADLTAYTPTVAEVKAVAAPQFGLPAVSIQVNGSIALIDNLQVFGTALTAYIERINREPKTDQDFADLEATVKTLKNAEDALDAAEAGALAQTESIDVMRRTVAMYRETARTNRLLIDKMVKVEKEARKLAIVSEAAAEFVSHMNALNKRIGKSYMPSISSDFPGAVRGLKSIDSMRDKVATELARCKIEANAIADKIDANLRHLSDVNAPMFLFSDLQQICLKSCDDFQMLVRARINDHAEKETARIEAERTRIAAEERAKAEAAIESAQAIVKAQSETYAELERSEIKRLSDLNNAMVVEVNEPQPGPMSPPTLKLGQIADRLGFHLTAQFLGSLGFKPSDIDGRALLFHENDFPRMCAALVRHIQQVSQGVAA